MVLLNSKFCKNDMLVVICYVYTELRRNDMLILKLETRYKQKAP